MKNKLIVLITGLLLAGGVFAFADNSVIQFDPNTRPAVDKKIQIEDKIDTVVKNDVSVTQKQTQTTLVNVSEYIPIDILAVLSSPDNYVNKKIRFKASFDKFSTLGLDYKPAFRDSQKYISFLIKRPDVTDHTVPLSEVKIFITRDEAEKFIDLDSGDTIDVFGKVFSSALTDVWVDVDKLVVLDKKNKEDKKK